MTIQEILETSPENIRVKSEAVEEAEMLVKACKNALSVAEAKATLNHLDSNNQLELKARIATDPDVCRIKIELIEAEGKYRKSVIGLEHAENRFISARKIAGLDERVLHSISSANIA